MSTIQAIIIDDEVGSISVLKNLLERFCPRINIVATSTDSEQAFGLIKKHEPQLLFLDIDMPRFSGIEIAQSFQQTDIKVIFVTAYDSFAIPAVKVNAIDYLLKPIHEKDLIEAVTKAEIKIEESEKFKQLQKNAFTSDINQGKTIERIPLPTADGFVMVNIEEILRCQGDGAYTHFHLTTGKTITVSYNLGEFEKQLTPYGFFRIHNSHLINLKYLMRYNKGRGGVVIMNDNTELDVSARRKDDFIKLLDLKGKS